MVLGEKLGCLPYATAWRVREAENSVLPRKGTYLPPNPTVGGPSRGGLEALNTTSVPTNIAGKEINLQDPKHASSALPIPTDPK